MFDVDGQKGLTLVEIADGVGLDSIRAATGCPFEVVHSSCSCSAVCEFCFTHAGVKDPEAYGTSIMTCGSYCLHVCMYILCECCARAVCRCYQLLCIIDYRWVEHCH